MDKCPRKSISVSVCPLQLCPLPLELPQGPAVPELSSLDTPPFSTCTNNPGLGIFPPHFPFPHLDWSISGLLLSPQLPFSQH